MGCSVYLADSGFTRQLALNVPVRPSASGESSRPMAVAAPCRGVRMNGLKKYFDSLEYKRVIKESKISVLDPDESKKNILEFLDNNPKVKGIAVLNSRGFILADILASQGINDIRIITFDMTVNNVRCVENGTISAIIHQRPELQGFYAVKGIIRILLYNIPDKNVHHLMPADIIIKENLPIYKEIYSE